MIKCENHQFQTSEAPDSDCEGGNHREVADIEREKRGKNAERTEKTHSTPYLDRYIWGGVENIRAPTVRACTRPPRTGVNETTIFSGVT